MSLRAARTAPPRAHSARPRAHADSPGHTARQGLTPHAAGHTQVCAHVSATTVLQQALPLPALCVPSGFHGDTSWLRRGQTVQGSRSPRRGREVSGQAGSGLPRVETPLPALISAGALQGQLWDGSSGPPAVGVPLGHSVTPQTWAGCEVPETWAWLTWAHGRVLRLVCCPPAPLKAHPRQTSGSPSTKAQLPTFEEIGSVGWTLGSLSVVGQLRK